MLEEVEALIHGILAKFFTSSELSLLKVFLVGWVIVELRTRKRFGAQQTIIEKMEKSFAAFQESFISMQKTIKDLITTIARVELEDSKSTKQLTERLDRQTSTIEKLSNFLHRIGNRTTIVETKLGIIPTENNTEETT